MDWSLILAIGSLAISAGALARAWVPPQVRQVHGLTGRVEDLEAAHEDIRARLTRRAQRDNMSAARDAKSDLDAQARAILDAAAQAPQELPTDKAALRARLLRRA